ncbi:lytic transglycosylase domain-containing protein [Mobilicoccus massiliensis]|uniref:lytic transglycosylase domain-containing protein n=1 Tax=Mobilicoccus massiliensis TaxID=1522310 RepID=UPI0006943881|nr:lytic transglycosylase domain-containing protein [Mobilicoccus massiliensis]
MSRRGAWSRVSERLRRSVSGSGRDSSSGTGGLTRARQATVVGAASTIALAPLAAGAPPEFGLSSSELPRPVGVVSVAGPRTAVPASLPWLGVARNGSGLPAVFAGLTAASPTGIPAPVAAAYRSAEASLVRTQAGCHLPWWLLAGIGHVESGHAGGRVDGDGRTQGVIYGPVLDGSTPETAVVPDTDRGALDGDTAYDRAVGPMQFLPSTWRSFGADGDADGKADPHDIDDAALSAGRYLCSGGDDLRDRAALRTAILRYNPSETYVHNVLAAGEAYRDGRTPPPLWIPPVGAGDSPRAAVPPTVVAAGPPARSATAPAAPRSGTNAIAPREGTGTSAATRRGASTSPTVTRMPSAPRPAASALPTTRRTTARPTGSPRESTPTRPSSTTPPTPITDTAPDSRPDATTALPPCVLDPSPTSTTTTTPAPTPTTTSTTTPVVPTPASTSAAPVPPVATPTAPVPPASGTTQPNGTATPGGPLPSPTCTLPAIPATPSEPQTPQTPTTPATPTPTSPATTSAASPTTTSTAESAR